MSPGSESRFTGAARYLTVGDEAMAQPLGVQHMSDHPAQLRLKAEACRRLADLAEDAERETLWLIRANNWDQLATKAEQKSRARSRPRL